jgi:hypothetical protein
VQRLDRINANKPAKLLDFKSLTLGLRSKLIWPVFLVFCGNLNGLVVRQRPEQPTVILRTRFSVEGKLWARLHPASGSLLSAQSSLLGGFSAAAQTSADSLAAGATRWVAANAIPIEAVEAGHGFRDLQPFREVIGDARIVALGESTHGTREFFQLKHREELSFSSGR